MIDVNTHDTKAIAVRLAMQSQGEHIRITAHAHQEMVEEDIALHDVLCALRKGTVVENYPDHKRGPCCLVYG
jgi:hypothetical protein